MRREVKKIWLKLFIFLLPFALFFGWVEYQARLLPDSYLQKKRLVEQQKDRIKILILGSSHAFDGINPDYFSCRGFNFSNSSQSLFYDSELCLQYLDQMPELKSVVITISYFSLWFEMNEIAENWRDYFYYHHFQIRHPEMNRHDPVAFFYTALYTRRIINDMILGRLDFKTQFGDIRPNGWQYIPPPGNRDDFTVNAGKMRAGFHTSLVRAENLEKNIGYLEALLTALNRRNITAVFVIPPVYHTYSDHIQPDIMDKNRQIIAFLSKKYHCLSFDYFRDERFDISDFSNNDHLNYTGAEKFTRILDEDFISKICDQ